MEYLINNINSSIKRHDGTGFAILDGVEALTGIEIIGPIPEFNILNGNERGVSMFERHLGQCFQNLRSALLLLNEKTDAFTLDLRYFKQDSKSPLRVFLLIRVLISSSFIQSALQELFESVEGLLPPKYHYDYLNKTDLKEIISNPKDWTTMEISKSVQILSTGNKDALFKTSSIIPDLQTAKINNQGLWDIGIDPDLNYLSPVVGKANAIKYTQIADLLNSVPVQDSFSFTIRLSSQPTNDYIRAYANQFLQLIQQTYRSSAYLENEKADDYINQYHHLIYHQDIPLVKILVSGQKSRTVTTISTILANLLGPSYGTREGVPDEDFFEITPFIMNSNKRRPEVQPFLDLIQYVATWNELEKSFLHMPVSDGTTSSPFETQTASPFIAECIQNLENSDGIRLGKIKENRTEYILPTFALNSHILIAGTTGSGKSTTLVKTLKELIKRKIPFLAIEPIKSELRELMNGASNEFYYFQVNSPYLPDGKHDPSFLRINPLIPVAGNLSQHIQYLHSSLCSAFPIYGITGLVLEDALIKFYQIETFNENGKTYKKSNPLTEKDLFDPKKNPQFQIHKDIRGKISMCDNDMFTIERFSKWFPSYLQQQGHLYADEKLRFELEGVMLRRLQKLTSGIFGEIFCPEKWRKEGDCHSITPNILEIILNKPCVIDLNGLIRNDDKAFIMNLVLSYLMQYKSNSKSNNQHITVIEESHRVLGSSGIQRNTGESLSANATTTFIDLFSSAMAELRSKKEGFILLEQSPSKLIPDVVKLTNTKIIHRLVSAEERGFIGKSMGLDSLQTDYILNQKNGEAVIFSGSYNKPQNVKIFKR